MGFYFGWGNEKCLQNFFMENYGRTEEEIGG
jgi:hypothetical protein